MLMSRSCHRRALTLAIDAISEHNARYLPAAAATAAAASASDAGAGQSVQQGALQDTTHHRRPAH